MSNLLVKEHRERPQPAIRAIIPRQGVPIPPSAWMEAIGRLAGGIAHDVNNVLGVILNSATMITLEQQENSTINEKI